MRTVAGIEINVNVEKIAEGLHAMHKERGEEALISFGMLSAPLMESAERELKEAAQRKVNAVINHPKNVIKLIDAVADPEKVQEDLKRFVRDTMRDITVAIYKRVKMVV